MFRLVSLAALLAVAYSQTLLYPSSIAKISLPLQSQIALQPQFQYQFQPLYPISSSIYRYPSSTYLPNYQFILPLQQRPLITRTLPLVWSRSGRSLGAVRGVPATAAATSAIVSQPQTVAAAGHSVQGYQVADQGVQAIRVESLPSGQLAIVPTSGAAVHHHHQQQQPIVEQGIAGGLQGGALAVSSVPAHHTAHQQVHGQQSIVGILTASPIVDSSKLSGGDQPLTTVQSSHVAGGQVLPASSVPIAYSVELPKNAQVVSVGQQGIVPAVHHHEPAGHHQVSHVTIPNQVGVGGGYTSSAFYESSPSGVVIPLGAEPIVASDVKVNAKASQAIVDPVVHAQTHAATSGGVGHHQTVGVQSFDG